MITDYMFPKTSKMILEAHCNDLSLDSMPKYEEVTNGTVLPMRGYLGGVADQEGNFVELSRHAADCHKFGGLYKFSTDLSIVKGNIIYLGYIHQHWGHFLMESLGRLWFLLDSQFDDRKIVFLGVPPNENQLQIIDLLMAGRARERIIAITRPTQFSSVIVPEMCVKVNFRYCQAFPQLFRRIVTNAPIDHIEVQPKVYLSRQALTIAQSKELGEKDLESLLRGNGYAVYYPERLSALHQIAIFNKATEIVCINGTIPLNICFSLNSKLRLIVLNKASLLHMNLVEMAQVANIEPIYIDVFKEPIKRHPTSLGGGPFWMQINRNFLAFLSKHGSTTNHIKDTVLKTMYSYGLYYSLYVLLVKIKTPLKRGARIIRKLRLYRWT
jgi:hypothetical protein